MGAPVQVPFLFRPASRLSAIGVSEILKITGLATELKGQGKDVITLGAGEPDFDTPDHVKDAAERAMRAGATKYTALDGAPELKAAIRAKFKRDNGLEFASEEITVSAWAKQVLFNGMMATLDPGDEVVIPTPYWVSYADIVIIAGGKAVVVPCSEANGFRLTAEDLDRAITKRTRWLILNSPSNPTGAAYSASGYRPILDVVRERRRSFQARRDFVVAALNKIDGIACRSPENVFYAFASCAGLIGKTAPVSASRAIRILRNICCAPQASQSFPVRPSAFLAIFPHLLRDLYRGTRRSMCHRIAAAGTQLS